MPPEVPLLPELNVLLALLLPEIGLPEGPGIVPVVLLSSLEANI